MMGQQKELDIWDPDGNNSMSVMGTNVEGAKKSGNIAELILKDSRGNEHRIKKIPDGTIIDTEYNPHCRWYFIASQWFYI